MNKKLFSWKALAGLALLVAMGLTSCKQGEEVDPSNPTAKPVKPGTSTAGKADLTFTITNGTDGDPVTLWNKWVKDNKEDAAALMAEKEVTIALDFSNYKLDGKAIALPKFVTTPNGSIINLNISNFAEAKEAFNLDLNSSNFKGAEVNIFLPAAEFDMILDATGAKVTLASEGEATLKTLDATADAVKKNALTIGDGVTVNGIDMTGALVATTDNVISKLVSSDEVLVDAKGAHVGEKDVADLYVKNLTLTASAKVSNAVKAPLDKITLNEGVTLTLGTAKSSVKEIVGLGDITKTAKQNTVVFAGDADDLSAIGALENVILSNKVATKVSDMSIFENVVFNMDVDLYTNGASNTEFKKAVNVKIENDIEEVKFSNVNFGVKSTLTMAGAVTVSGKNKYMNMYQWDVNKKNYVKVASDNEDDLYEANKKSSAKYVKVVQSLYSEMPTGVKMTGGKFVFDTDQLGTLNKAYEAALKAYKTEITKNGLPAANKNTTIVDALYDAWKAINGIAAKVEYKDADDATKDIEVKFTAFEDDDIATAKSSLIDAYDKKKYDTNDEDDLETIKGYARQYADQLAFVAKVNTAIDGCDWFEIYFAKETTNTPDGVILSFDADCTSNGKAFTVEKLNNLIDADKNGFASKKDIWFDVVNDETLLEWAGNSSVGYYLK